MEKENKENKGVLSPLTPYDYNKHRDETIVPAMVKILKLLGENAEEIFEAWGKTPESSKEIQTKIGAQVVTILAQSGVARTDLDACMNIPQSFYVALSNIVMSQIRNHEHEIMSRVVGAKNPGNNKFDLEYSTYGDLLKSLIQVRKDTGDNVEDYFTLNPDAGK